MRVVTDCVPSHFVPAPNRNCSRSCGTSFESSAPVASPRAVSAARVARSASSSQVSTSSVMAPSPTICSRRLRSLAATASVAAACAMPASSIGNTHIVRRIASMRTSPRSS